MADSTVARIATTGMHCRSCTMLVEMSVGDLAGVESVHSDLATGLTEVTFDPSAVSTDAIVAEIVKAGYGAELLS